jgi:hypothetical protein
VRGRKLYKFKKISTGLGLMEGFALKKILVFVLIALMTICQAVSQDVVQEQQQIVQEPANSDAITQRQLTLMKADILKQIEQISTNILEDNRKYNDENYGAFDVRMQAFMKSTQRKVIVGVLGLNFFIAAAIGFIYNWINKKHSLYTYHKGLDKRQKMFGQVSSLPNQAESIQQAGQQQYSPVSPSASIGQQPAEFYPDEQQPEPYPEPYPQYPENQQPYGLSDGRTQYAEQHYPEPYPDDGEYQNQNQNQEGYH